MSDTVITDAPVRRAPALPRTLTSQELADHLGVKVAWVYRAVAAGRVVGMKAGGRNRFTLAQVAAIEASLTIDPPARRRSARRRRA